MTTTDRDRAALRAEDTPEEPRRNAGRDVDQGVGGDVPGEAPGRSGRQPSPSRLSAADILTLGNSVCGFSSVYFITTAVLVPYLTGGPGDGTLRQGAATAVMLILLASLFDLCDGLVTEKRARRSTPASSTATAPTTVSHRWEPSPTSPQTTTK